MHGDQVVTEYRVAWLTRRHHPATGNLDHIESVEDFATRDDAELHLATVSHRWDHVEGHLYPIRVYLTHPAPTGRTAA